MPDFIPVSNPKANYLAHKEEIDDAIARVLGSGWYILGEEVEAFEEEFAAYIGTRYCIAVGNGTDALQIALTAAGVGVGDEVVTTDLTASATGAAILATGATLQTVQVKRNSCQMWPSDIGRAVNDSTMAVVPVHLYGFACDMPEIEREARSEQLLIVEDCAQAHGAISSGIKAGSWGELAAFSFYPTKNLGALGDGGAVVTSSQYYAQEARRLREYGWSAKHLSGKQGQNSRLDTLQAAVLRVKLCYLEQENHRRRQIAQRYYDGLSGIGPTFVAPYALSNDLSVYHQFVVYVDERQKFRAFLAERNIQTLIHYPFPLHEQPAFKGCMSQFTLETRNSVSDICRQVVSLPMYPELTNDQVDRVIMAVKAFYSD